VFNLTTLVRTHLRGRYVSDSTINVRFGSPNGATLVKEVIETSTGKMTTGTVSHADKLKGWFVMVKDRKNDHPGNKLWGDGCWGWSWFDADKPLKTTSTDYKADCLSCYVPRKTPIGSIPKDIRRFGDNRASALNRDATRNVEQLTPPKHPGKQRLW
jgi:cytochrome P460